MRGNEIEIRIAFIQKKEELFFKVGIKKRKHTLVNLILPFE